MILIPNLQLFKAKMPSLSSLEAERIRSELKKAFIYLYEDWLDYEFSDVSEENYESLQAIIKKIFRSLERNGIDFKGSNE